MKTKLINGLNDFYCIQDKIEIIVKKRAASFDWKVAAVKYLKKYKKHLF
jgi:hypothetical protein